MLLGEPSFYRLVHPHLDFSLDSLLGVINLSLGSPIAITPLDLTSLVITYLDQVGVPS